MDIEILLWFQELREATAGLANGFCELLALITIDFFVLLPFLIVYWAYDKKRGLYVLGSYGFASLINSFMKVTFCVYRPWIRDARIKPLPAILKNATGYSFPSGHSTLTASVYGGIMAGFPKDKRLSRLCLTMILLTMLSRLYLGVHTPQDVIVGAASGLLSVLLVLKAEKFINAKEKGDIAVLLISWLLCILFLIYVLVKPYPMDYVDGVLLVDPEVMKIDAFKDPGIFIGIVTGWFIERRYIKFDTNVSSAKKVKRCLLGGILFALYWTIMLEGLSSRITSGVLIFIIYLSAPLLFMTVFPILFTKLEAKEKE